MMDENIRLDLETVRSGDRQARYEAYLRLMTASDGPVDWGEQVWDGLRADLDHKDNHVRAIAAQLLCNLARSLPAARLLADLPALLAATHDERFVTARHSLQALWKVGLAGPAQRRALLEGLTGRFAECVVEKNGSLTRSDILAGLRQLYQATGDEAVRARSLALIEVETDLELRRKYSALWNRR